jgi:homoserine O-acetyltransferase/O-succinyltransferase
MSELKTLSVEQPPPLESGGRLGCLEIGYRSWGRLDAGAGNAVLVCPALTGDSDLESWWPGLLGPGRALDPDTDFVVCPDVLGGCGATTGPRSRDGNGQRWKERFPAVSVRDMVNVQQLLLERLGVRRLKLVIGGSLGGMQALEWAVGWPEQVEAAAVIAAPPAQSAWARAFNHVQRRALETHGDIELARMIAMLSYRHWDNIDARFGDDEQHLQSAEAWLDYHGKALRARFNPISYSRLMAAMDSHDVGRGRGGWRTALARTRTPVQIIAITSDLLYPPRDQQQLADTLPAARLDWLDAPQGHDAFLIEQDLVECLVAGFRRQVDALARRSLKACP